eukprot:5637892-Amphidinium_carterae.1
MFRAHNVVNRRPWLHCQADVRFRYLGACPQQLEPRPPTLACPPVLGVMLMGSSILVVVIVQALGGIGCGNRNESHTTKRIIQ